MVWFANSEQFLQFITWSSFLGVRTQDTYRIFAMWIDLRPGFWCLRLSLSLSLSLNLSLNRLRSSSGSRSKCILKGKVNMPSSKYPGLQIPLWDTIATVVSAIKCWWGGGVRSIRSLLTSQPYSYSWPHFCNRISVSDRFSFSPINNSLISHKFLCFFLTLSSSFSQVLILSLKLLNVKAFM